MVEDLNRTMRNLKVWLRFSWLDDLLEGLIRTTSNPEFYLKFQLVSSEFSRALYQPLLSVLMFFTARIKLLAQNLIWFEYFAPHAQCNLLGPLSSLTSCFYGAIKDDGSCVPGGRVVTMSYEKLATLITPRHHIA
jgi:hypothetical protein